MLVIVMLEAVRFADDVKVEVEMALLLVDVKVKVEMTLLLVDVKIKEVLFIDIVVAEDIVEVKSVVFIVVAEKGRLVVKPVKVESEKVVIVELVAVRVEFVVSTELALTRTVKRERIITSVELFIAVLDA